MNNEELKQLIDEAEKKLSYCEIACCEDCDASEKVKKVFAELREQMK